MSDGESPTELQDRDHDGLDDRLTPAGAAARDVGDILKRLEHIRLESLPPETLRLMDRDLRAEQRGLVVEAEAIEHEIHLHLTRGEGRMLEPLRKRIRQLKRNYEELEDNRLRVYDGLQRHLMRANMIARLGSARRVDRFEGLVMVLIVFILTLLIYDFAYNTSPAVSSWIYVIDVAFCAIFLSEFFLRHRSAEDKRWFWRRHWIDLVTSIPFPGNAQVARFGRVARLARVLRVLRLVRVFRVVFFFWRGMDRLQHVMDVRLMKRALRLGVVVMILGAFVIWWLEGDAAEVGSLAQGLWWSFTTVVTGGFGDIYNPATATGRFLTALLVLTGMILVGVFTATLTSLYVGDDSEELALMQKRLEEKIDRLAERVEALVGQQQEKQ